MKSRVIVVVLIVSLVGGFFQAFAPATSVDAQSGCAERDVACLIKLLNSARSQDQANAILASFSSEEQQLVIAALQPANTEQRIILSETTHAGLDMEGRARQCGTVSVEVITNNSIGNKAASYWQSIYWCWNNKKVKVVSRNRWAEIHQYFYQFNGHVGNQERGGVGQLEYYAWTQGEFGFCPPIPNGCVATWYMQASQTVRKDGSHTP